MPTHFVAAQTSLEVQALLSLQALVFASFLQPVFASQLSVVQTFPSSHLAAVPPLQLPPAHVRGKRTRGRGRPRRPRHRRRHPRRAVHQRQHVRACRRGGSREREEVPWQPTRRRRRRRMLLPQRLLRRGAQRNMHAVWILLPSARAWSGSGPICSGFLLPGGRAGNRPV